MGSLKTCSLRKFDANDIRTMLRKRGEYADALTCSFERPVDFYHVGFTPLGKEWIYVLDEKNNTVQDLSVESSFVNSLDEFWSDVPLFFVLIFGKPRMNEEDAKNRWIAATIPLLQKSTS